MNSTVLNNFLDRFAIDSSNLKVHYTFDASSGEVLWNSLYTIPEHFTGDCLLANKYPGISVGHGETPTSGSSRIGTFRYADSLRIGYQLTDPNWTVFLDFEAQNHCGDNPTDLAVLLSNKDSVTDDGFLLGLNRSNRLVFESWTNSLKTNQILFDEVADGAVVSLSKDIDTFELVYHNHLQSEHNSISFDLTGYSPQNNWYLGGLFTPSQGYTGLSGYFNEFLYFDAPIGKASKDGFSKAFFVTGIFDSFISTGVQFISSISNVEYNPSGFLGTGIIGYDTSSILIPDNDAGADPTYLCLTEGITGFLVGETIEFITGSLVSIPSDVFSPARDLYNYSKLLTYSKSNLVYDAGIVGTDVLEIYGFKEPNSALNLSSDFDSFYSKFKIPFDNAALYFNGAYQESGIDYSVYNSFLTASGFEVNDGTIYDIVSGVRSRYEYHNLGTGTFHISGVDAEKDVYLNGQKLISGMNYTGAGSNLFLLNTEALATGFLQFLPRSPDIYQIKTGNADLNSFKYVVEQAWLNGQRIKNHESFIRTNYCTIRGQNGVPLYGNLIYGNSDDFWGI